MIREKERAVASGLGMLLFLLISIVVAAAAIVFLVPWPVCSMSIRTRPA